MRIDLVIGLALSAGLLALAFLTGSGVIPGSDAQLGANTWSEIALLLIGSGMASAVVLCSAPGAAWGLGALAGFAALSGLSGLSIAWSVAPDVSWNAANQSLALLAAFGCGLALARLVPAAWRAPLGAIALAATVLSGYALLAKVLPGSLDSGDALGRLNAPFSYWNATGLIAAMGLPACLWAGSRRVGARWPRTFSMPAFATLGAVVILSYSRSALLAAIAGCALWFAVVPLRLRAVLVLIPGTVGTAAIALWALARPALTADGQPLAARTSAGHGFAIVILVVLIACALGGSIAIARADRRTLGVATRRRIGIALLCVLALVPVGGLVELAASSRGLTGEVSHLWSTLTSTNASVGDTPGRLVDVANSRPRYWSEGFTVGAHAPVEGAGALGYAVARERWTSDPLLVTHAHSYVIQTFADLGVLGIAVSLLLLVAWALATRRTLSSRVPARASSTGDSRAAGRAPERAGLLTLLCVVVTFGVQSTIDWTWFIPGVTVPALLCAGWLAGRGPLRAPIGRIARRRGLLDRPWIPLTLAAVTLVAVGGAWAIWQPLRSVQAGNAAISLASGGRLSVALADARDAVSRNPLSLGARNELSALLDATGESAAARAELVTETTLQPENYHSWFALGSYDLAHGRAVAAVGEIHRANLLDRTNGTFDQAYNRAVEASRR